MNSFARQILDDHNGLMDRLTEEQLLVDANPLEITEHEDQTGSGRPFRTTSLSWAGASGLAYLMDEYASIDQYINIVKRRDFNFCIYDGSLVQIYYQVTAESIVKHRLCFIPCPFLYPREELVGLGLADIPELMSDGEMKTGIRLCSPIRFDFDANFCDDKHTHSHVTLNQSSCRVPAYGPISLGHFIRFVFRYFYEDVFHTSNWWHNFTPRVYNQTLGIPFPHEFHLKSSHGAA